MKRSNIDTWICKTEQFTDLTRSALEKLQLDRLNELLARIHTFGGFYQNLPEKISSLEELQYLPFTTPEMLAAHSRNLLLTSQSHVSRVISGATSGTTGPSKRIFYSEKDTANTIGFFAAGISEMVQPGEKVLIAFPFSGAFSLGDLIERAVLSLGAVPLRVDDRKTYKELCTYIAKERPDAYIGFPVSLLSMARMYPSVLSSVGLPSSEFPIKRALISGDSCPKGVVDALEQLLQSRTFPHYGSREMVMGGAITCPAHEGMHLRENHIIGEIIGPDLKPVPDGEWGELVITTIGMEAMPLIRYRTGDHTRFLPDPCPCQSVTKRLDTVTRGNVSDASIEALDSALFSVQTLVDYQAALQNDTLTITAYTLDGHNQTSLTDRAKNILPFSDIVIRESTCQPEYTALYPGKRYILS